MVIHDTDVAKKQTGYTKTVLLCCSDELPLDLLSATFFFLFLHAKPYVIAVESP
jgi:hypothetical protein